MASRTAFRLTRAATPLFSAPRATIPRALPIAARSFNKNAAQRKSDVVQETEVPVSVYAPDATGSGTSSSDHFSIPVSRENAKPTSFPTGPENDDVTPLAQKVYSTMPPTMQKMSIMDKVVIVTG